MYRNKKRRGLFISMIDFFEEKRTLPVFFGFHLFVAYLLMLFIGSNLIGTQFYMGFLFFISIPFLVFLIIEEVQYKRLMISLTT